MTPYEVLAGPITVYIAPVATSFPAIAAAPSGSWTLLGTNGAKNQDESGVVITHGQTISKWYSAGSTGVQKVFRSQEDLMIEFKLADLSAATYAKILNNATVTTVNPTTVLAGESAFPMKQGSTVATFAMLLRGLSPAGDAFNAQYEAPIVYQGGSPKPAFAKNGPALLDCQFGLIEDPSLGLGTLRIQTAAHS